MARVTRISSSSCPLHLMPANSQRLASRAINMIGGLIHPAGGGWMYTRGRALLWGTSYVFRLQTARSAVSRPFDYFS